MSSVYPIREADDIEGVVEFSELDTLPKVMAPTSVKSSTLFQLESEDNGGKLADLDADGDGQITQQEMELYVTQHKQTERDKSMLQKGAAAMALLLILFAGAMIWSIYGIVDGSKDTKSGTSQNALRDRESGFMVTTASPLVYTAITELPLLPAAAINSLKQLSFTTVDGYFHLYDVQGVKMSANTNTMLHVYFVGNKILQVYNGTATLQATDPTGLYTETGVIVSSGSADTLARRRTQLFDEAEDDTHPHWETRQDLANRCSITKGVCYHTYEEIVSLGRHSQFEKDEIAQGRRLQEGENAVTYAAITIDTAILQADSRSDLSAARSFLQGVLDSGALDDVSGTVQITFTMKERCANYIDLVEECALAPAPDLLAANADPTEVTGKLRPFVGLHPEQSKWVFIDEIEYNKDPYTIQLKVRYSHDAFSSRRRHVVLMSVADPSKIISYDEVELTYNPENFLISLAVPTLFKTNYKVVTELDDELASFIDSEDVPSQLRRRLSTPEARFQQHIRTKIAGFPDVYIPDAWLTGGLVKIKARHAADGSSARTSAQRRKLQALYNNTDDGDDYVDQFDDDEYMEDDPEESEDEEGITIAATMTTANVHSLVDISNTTEAETAGTIGNATLFEVEFVGTVQKLPCVLTGNSTDQRGNDLASLRAEMREPTTLFDSLEIDTLPGLIQWVDRGDTYQIEEFASAPIMQRANLRKDRDYHASLAATEFDLTDNAPDPSSGLASGAKSPRVHFDTSRKHPHPAGERLDPHFDALHSHLGHMSAFIKQSHKRVLTRAHTRHRNPGYPLSEEEYEVMFASKEVLAMHSQDTPGDGDGDWAAQAAKAAAELMQPKSLILRNATQLETAGTRRELLGSRSRKPDPTRFDSAHIARVIAKHSAVIALQKQLAESIKTNSWEVTREFIDQMGGNVDLFKLNLFEEAVSIVKNRSTTYMAKVGDVQGDCWRLGNTATVLLNDIDQILEIHEKVAATLETFTDGIADLQELDEALLIMEELQKFLKPIIVPVSAIPMGVGALIKKFYDAYSLLVKTAVSPIQGATGKITAQFTESRMDRVEKIQELIDDWGEKLAELRDVLSTVVMTLVSLDGVVAAKGFKWGSVSSPCGFRAHSTVKYMCQKINEEIIALDTSRWKGRLNEWVQYVVYTAAPVFQLVYEFLSSPAWALLGPVLDALQVTFNVINGFLNTRISISGMPFVCWKDVWECVTVGYPSGAEQCCTKKCRWGVCSPKLCIPCGVKTSSEKICSDIPTPYACKIGCSFTIKEVLDGLMSVVQPLMDAMDLLMKKALKALNIQLPTITIPGLPSLYRLDRFFDGFLAFTHFGYSPWRGLSIQGHFDALEKLKDKMAVFATDVTCEDLRTTRWDAWMNGGSYE